VLLTSCTKYETILIDTGEEKIEIKAEIALSASMGVVLEIVG